MATHQNRTGAERADSSLTPAGAWAIPAPRRARVSRWAVVVGTVFYCVLAWALVFEFGGAAISALKQTPTHLADR